MSKHYDITSEQHWFIGEDKLLVFDIVDANEGALDVDSYQMEWVLRRHPGDTTRLIVKASGGGLTVDAGITSRVLVDIDDTDTLGLLPGRYAHALRRTDAGYEGVLSFGMAELQEVSAR